MWQKERLASKATKVNNSDLNDWNENNDTWIEDEEGQEEVNEWNASVIDTPSDIDSGGEETEL
jgi:hypothetical protein